MSPHPLTLADAPLKRRLLLRPNRSLSRRGRTVLFLALAAATVVLGALFMLTGAWPVVPFLFLELLGVGYVLQRMARNAGDCEEIVIEDDRISVIQLVAGRATQQEFQRYWAKVALEPVCHGRHAARLMIGSHGRTLEIARALQEGEKQALARQLRQMVGPGNRNAASTRGGIIFNSCKEETHGNFASR